MAEEGLKIDELAQEAGVATTTVRLYQSKGLLPGPRLVGRTGYYDDGHLARLRLIARLQDEGFSLAGIARLLETWQHGRDLAEVIGVEEQLEQILGTRREVVLSAAELLARFPDQSLTPELVQRAAALGLVEPTDDGRFRVPDERFVTTGSALAALGIPAATILDEWEQLRSVTDALAARFVTVFEQHVLPDDWLEGLGPDEVARLAGEFDRLRRLAHDVTAAALDASLGAAADARLGALAPPHDLG